MITLTGIFSESFGGTCTIRGYAKYTDIVNSSYPHPHYQRPEDAQHIEDISNFITSGTNSFSPEVVLAYTTEYDYYAAGANGDIDAVFKSADKLMYENKLALKESGMVSAPAGRN